MKKFSMASNYYITMFIFGMMAAIIVFPGNAFASSSISEFTRPMELFIELLSGPVIRGIGVISLVICSLMLALQWSSVDDSTRKFLFIIIALSLAMVANKVIASWFGFSGAVI